MGKSFWASGWVIAAVNVSKPPVTRNSAASFWIADMATKVGAEAHRTGLVVAARNVGHACDDRARISHPIEPDDRELEFRNESRRK